MAWEEVHSQDGTYAVDWETVRRLIRAYWRARKQNEMAETRTESQKTVNPASWFMPDLTTVEVDWERVRTEADAAADAEYMAMRWNAHSSMRSQIRKLHDLVRGTVKEKARFRVRLEDAQSKSFEALQGASSSYETAITIAEMTRDASAGTLLIGATVVSGGSAAAGWTALGAGSALSGWGKYQDTGNIGAASVEVVSSLMFNCIPVARGGKALKGVEKVTVLFLRAQWDTAGAIIEGKSVGQALTKGGLRMVVDPAIGALVKSDAVMKRLERWVVPGVASVLVKEAPDRVRQFVVKETEQVAKYAVKKSVSALMKGGGQSGRTDPPAGGGQGGSAGLDRAQITGEWLIDLAIIDMGQGIRLP